MSDISRHLNWQGSYNVRDLGGLPLAGGGETRFGALVRADHLGRLTPTGRRQLLEYGVGHILDLRFADEVLDTPSAVFGDGEEAPRYRNIPLMTENEAVDEKLDRVQSWAELYQIVLDHNMENYAAALRAIANAEGSLVFHCHSGKDRTGMLAALLLDLAGVERQAIADDYAQSQERLWPLWEQEVAEAGGEENIRRWFKPDTEPETMLAVFEHLDREYGGTAGYLRAAGLTEEELAVLRQRLR